MSRCILNVETKSDPDNIIVMLFVGDAELNRDQEPVFRLPNLSNYASLYLKTYPFLLALSF